jgi:hypothetical protein
MRSINLILSALRPIRFLVAVCVCALLVFSYAFPAFSDPVNPTASRTAPQQGEAQLRNIEKGAQEAVLAKPYSLEETQARAQQGTNEIQGAADLDKMKRPENAQADSVEEKSKNFLEAFTGKKDIRDLTR